jgi:hypothetical protein
MRKTFVKLKKVYDCGYVHRVSLFVLIVNDLLIGDKT